MFPNEYEGAPCNIMNEVVPGAPPTGVTTDQPTEEPPRYNASVTNGDTVVAVPIVLTYSIVLAGKYIIKHCLLYYYLLYSDHSRFI